MQNSVPDSPTEEEKEATLGALCLYKMSMQTKEPARVQYLLVPSITVQTRSLQFLLVGGNPSYLYQKPRNNPPPLSLPTLAVHSIGLIIIFNNNNIFSQQVWILLLVHILYLLREHIAYCASARVNYCERRQRDGQRRLCALLPLQFSAGQALDPRPPSLGAAKLGHGYVKKKIGPVYNKPTLPGPAC